MSTLVDKIVTYTFKLKTFRQACSYAYMITGNPIIAINFSPLELTTSLFKFISNLPAASTPHKTFQNIN